MSLEDRFNPNDGGIIDTIDNSMVKYHKKLGDFWQNKTHMSSNTLKRILYGVAAISAFSTLDPITVCAAGVSNVTDAITGGGFGPKPKSGLDLEIQAEANGLPHKFFKLINLGLYGWAFYDLAMGLMGNPDSNMEKYQYTFLFSSWAAANYLHRASFEPPPPRPKRKPIRERINDYIGGLAPQPIPVPVPMG